MSGKLKSMSATKKTLVGLGAFILLFGAIGAATDPKPQNGKDLVQQTASVKSAATEEDVPEPAAPKIETKTEEVAQAIPFQSTTQNDSTLPSGQTKISVTGINGEKIITYTVTYEDGVESMRELTGERISKQPVNEVKKIGTKVAVAPAPPAPAPSSNCDPNYSGACVPIAYDVDCAGGSGNGPAYVVGPVYVIGNDIYELDRDGNGTGCE